MEPLKPLIKVLDVHELEICVPADWSEDQALSLLESCAGKWKMSKEPAVPCPCRARHVHLRYSRVL